MKQGYFELIASSMMYASFGIWVNYLAINGAQSSFVAAAGIAFLTLLWLHFSKGLKSLFIKTNKTLLLSLIIVSALTSWFIFEAMTLIPVGEAILLHYTAPLWVVLYNLVSGEEEIHKWAILSLFLGLAGTVLILGIENFLSLSNFMWGHLLALASGAFLGGIFLLRRKLRDSHSTKPLLFWVNFGMFLFFAPMVLPMTPPEPLWALVGFVLAAFGARFFFYEGIRQVPANISSIIMLLEPVGAAVLGWVILSQVLALESIMGAVLLLCSIYLLYTNES